MRYLLRLAACMAVTRGPITNLTLFGGFASTICWPLSAFMIDHVGWRSACFIYAALHLFVMLPLQASVVTRAGENQVRKHRKKCLPARRRVSTTKR